MGEGGKNDTLYVANLEDVCTRFVCTCASLCRTKCGSTFGGWVEVLKEDSVTVTLLFLRGG